MAKVCDATRCDEKSRRADPFSQMQPVRVNPNQLRLPIGPRWITFPKTRNTRVRYAVT